MVTSSLAYSDDSNDDLGKSHRSSAFFDKGDLGMGRMNGYEPQISESWTRRVNEVFGDQHNGSEEPFWSTTLKSAQNQIHIIWRHPSIIIISFFAFAILCSAGIVIHEIIGHSKDGVLKDAAEDLAIETGRWFSSQLDQAILPLFSMAQFVSEIQEFKNLPSTIGQAGEPGSLPFLPPKSPNDPPTHRNTTSVCQDDPVLVERFTQIASTIKRNAKMEGVLVNIQLAPDAVVCLLHPLVNTEDFPDGTVMDNTGAVGHDLLSDPARKFIAEATIPSDKVVIAGPLTLRQCQDCDPTVEHAFIARVPIEIKDSNHTIRVNGISYNRWGFAVVILNWNELINRSKIDDTFQKEGFYYQLTRTDQIFDSATGGYSQKTVILSESVGFDPEGFQTVSTELETTNNRWRMTVAYKRNDEWWGWTLTAIILLSSLVAILVYTVLIQKQMHADALAAKSKLMINAARQAAIQERELNDFIAHEVRNPLSAAISACSFVSSAVVGDEELPLLQGSKIETIQEDVTIIENSLQFVNDLLRNMLDMHRAASNQLKIENGPTDLLLDVLQPAASMLYKRDCNFKVHIDCPRDLVISTDSLRLKQVVLNLGRNSAKFVEKGFIKLRVTVDTKNDTVNIFVEDSGPGIPKEKQEKLFRKFQESLDSLSQGTGIGLSLCERLVSLMGGEIYHDASYNSGIAGCPGARLVVTLKTQPISVCTIIDESETDRGDSVDDDGNIQNGDDDDDENNDDENNNKIISQQTLPVFLKILFVDDSLVLRKLFRRTIEKFKPEWQVEEAASGETVLQLVESNTYDVIFMDQHMASTDKQLLGTETVRALRAKQVKSRICGLSANDLEPTFLDAGANCFHTKPLPNKVDELTKILLKILH